MAHANLLRTAKEYRIQVDMVDSCGKTGLEDFGCTSSDHTQCKMKASKKIEKRPTKNRNYHKHALNITNIE